jgi:chromosomal replication initiation ATPase DnaA
LLKNLVEYKYPEKKRFSGAKKPKKIREDFYMIKVIYGAKGTGKTKMMIEAANGVIEQAKGHMIFITDSKRGMYDLEREIRFIDVSEYDIAGEAALCGFIKGVIAGNHDNEYVYIDGIVRIAGKPVAELASFFNMLDKVATQGNLTITVTVTATKEELPDFVAKYV